MNVHELSLVSYLGLSCSLLVPVLRGESFNANGGGFELSSNAWITGVLHICVERLGFQLMAWMWLHCCQTNFSPQINDRGIVLYDQNRILKYENNIKICVRGVCLFMSRNDSKLNLCVVCQIPKAYGVYRCLLLMWEKLFFGSHLKMCFSSLYLKIDMLSTLVREHTDQWWGCTTLLFCSDKNEKKQNWKYQIWKRTRQICHIII